MTSPLTFLKETREELEKVVWPTQQQAFRLTVLVVTISIIVGLFIGGLDLALTKLLQIILR